jgi:hypothetical protein
MPAMQTMNSDPGYTAVRESGEWQGMFRGYNGELNMLVAPVQILSSTTDSGNTPTTTLRAGNILGKIAATGKYGLYDPSATNGLQIARGVLDFALDMIGPAGTVADKWVNMVTRANVVVGQLINSDAGALKRLIQLGFIFDAPAGAEAGAGFIGVVEKAADYTVVAADNGTRFLATTGAVAFTLPTKAHGLAFEFFNTVDANMSIVSAGSADDIYADGDAGADSVAFSTASHKIGSGARLECRYLGGNLKWFTQNLGATLATVT